MSTQEEVQGLGDLRAIIDRLDEQIIRALQARFDVVEEVGRRKRQVGVPVLQPRRRAEVADRYRRLGGELGLAPEFTASLAALILDEARRREDHVFATDPRSP